MGPSAAEEHFLYIVGALEPAERGARLRSIIRIVRAERRREAAFRNEDRFVFQAHCLLPQCSGWKKG